MKDPAGNAAPAGGFQNNGWYSGYNYYNGQFSQHAGDFAPGNPNGSGTVSAEVAAQTSKANVDYLNAQRAKTGATPIPSASNPNALNLKGGDANPTPTSNNTPNLGGMFSTPANNTGLDLTSMYTNLTQKAGIPDLQTKADAIQAQIDKVQSDLAAATSNENENPFLSEGNRVGRVSKLKTDAQNEIDALTAEKNSITDQITQKSTDIQNQIGLATQQYNINDQQKQEALGQFNTLLSSGLLSNLSTGDVTNIAASTGLPTSIIQEAITKSQQADRNVQMVQTSDGITLVDANTGDIIKSVKIPGMSSGSSTTTKDQNLLDTETAVGQYAKAGYTLKDIVNEFLVPGGLSAEQILSAYNNNSPYGKATETVDDIKTGNFSY